MNDWAYLLKEGVWYAEFLKHGNKGVWNTLIDSADSNGAEYCHNKTYIVNTLYKEPL